MAPTPLPDSAGSHAAASLGADFDPFTPDVIRDPQYDDGLIREMSLGLAPVVVRRLLPILRTILTRAASACSSASSMSSSPLTWPTAPT
jgi:hypothetical protein